MIKPTMEHITPEPISMNPTIKILILSLCLILTQTVHAQVRQQIDGNAQPREAAAPLAQTLTKPLDDPGTHAAHRNRLTRQQHQAFADAVDLSGFRRLAVFDRGRVKIVDTLAKEHIERIYGKSRFKDIRAGDQDKDRKDQGDYKYDPVFTYLDLIFNKPYYFDKPIIHVEVLPLREQLIAHLPQEERYLHKKLGRLTYAMLHDPKMRNTLMQLDTDLTMENAMRQVRVAIASFEGSTQELDIISPKPGDVYWIDIRTGLPRPPTGASLKRNSNAPALTPVKTGVEETWIQLANAWRAADTAEVNRLLAELTERVPAIHAETYPSTTRLQAEWLYNATDKFTIGWIAYLIATLSLLVAFYTNRRGLGLFGIGALIVGFLIHSGGMVVRSMLSGRWPIHNQFESYMAIAWFAVLVGLLLMIFKKQWMFGAAAAALGTCALIVANTVAIPSNEVAPVAGILATSNILYIHVNTVLISYALIALGFFISLIYLGVHYSSSVETVRLAAAGLGERTVTVTGSGGGNALGKAKLLNDLDKAQMVVLQIAFYVLGVGILLGAYWADHAWGRWWGWDPKETWALITWIVYLIAIHVRLAGGIRDRGFITAWLSVIGFFVMLWCYWGVNLLLAGLHSYA